MRLLPIPDAGNQRSGIVCGRTIALDRLSGGGQPPNLTPLTFVVMIITLGINLFVTTYEGREGRRLHSELLRYVLRRSWHGLQVRRAPQADRLMDGLYYYGGERWTRHFEALSEFAREARRHHIPVVVVLHDAYLQREEAATSEHYRQLHEPLLSFWKDCGFPVVDCYDLFQTHMRAAQRDDMKDLWVDIGWNDFHPNAQAHRLIAEALLHTIRATHVLEGEQPPASRRDVALEH